MPSTRQATLFPLGPEQHNSFICFHQGQAKATTASSQNLKPMGPPHAELGLELQERSPSRAQAHPKSGSASSQEPAAQPYLDSHFCSHRAGAVASVLHATALPGVALVCLIEVGVVEVCVVIQATAVNLRGRERKGWQEHLSGLPPGSNTIQTPLAHGGCHPAQPCFSGLLSSHLGTRGLSHRPSHTVQLSPH